MHQFMDREILAVGCWLIEYRIESRISSNNLANLTSRSSDLKTNLSREYWTMFTLTCYRYLGRVSLNSNKKEANLFNLCRGGEYGKCACQLLPKFCTFSVCAVKMC